MSSFCRWIFQHHGACGIGNSPYCVSLNWSDHLAGALGHGLFILPFRRECECPNWWAHILEGYGIPSTRYCWEKAINHQCGVDLNGYIYDHLIWSNESYYTLWYIMYMYIYIYILYIYILYVLHILYTYYMYYIRIYYMYYICIYHMYHIMYCILYILSVLLLSPAAAGKRWRCPWSRCGGTWRWPPSRWGKAPPGGGNDHRKMIENHRKMEV